MTDKADVDRAMTLAIAELRRHGGTEAQIEMLRQQFKALADEENAKLASEIIRG